jgi:hypothetical protein
MKAGVRDARREAAMTVLLSFIDKNPGCVASEIADGTGICLEEVRRYTSKRRMEFRSMDFMFILRLKNRNYYNHLLHDAEYLKSGEKEGMFINTSKFGLFDSFCITHGKKLTVSKLGECFVYDMNAPEQWVERRKLGGKTGLPKTK